MEQLSSLLNRTQLTTSSPSTGAPTPAPSTSALDGPRLPLDLQIKIMRMALPAREPFRFWLRSRVLRSWSLVGRSVGRVAQRDLFSHIVALSDDKLERVLSALESRPELGMYVREVHMEVASKNGQLRRLGGLCPYLVELHLRSVENIDLGDLNAFRELERLRLSACTLKRGKVAAHVWANGLVLPELTHLADESQGGGGGGGSGSSILNAGARAEESMMPALHRCENLRALMLKQRLVVPERIAAQLVAVMAPEVFSPNNVPLPRVALLALTEHVLHRPSADRLLKPKPRTWPRSTRVLLSHDWSKDVFASLGVILMALPLLEEVHLGAKVLARTGEEAIQFKAACGKRGIRLVGYREDDSHQKHQSTFHGVPYFFQLAERVIAEEEVRSKAAVREGKGRQVVGAQGANGAAAAGAANGKGKAGPAGRGRRVVRGKGKAAA